MLRNFLFILIFLGFNTLADEIKLPNWGTERVIDSARLLTKNEYQALNEQLINFENERGDGSQFLLYILPTTGSESIEQFSNRAFNHWGIGHKEKNNGLLLVVAINDHRVRFEVGYGYEGVFSDVIAGRIIRNYITPNFRSENYYLGIKSGIEAAIQIASGEPIENIESTNNVLFLKVLQMPFVGVYLAIFILSYMYNLVFGTRLRKIKINKDIKKAKENKISSKKSNKPRGHKIKRKTLMRLNDFLQYKYFFPTFSNMAPMMIVLTLLVIFFVQVAYDGEVTPITVMAMVFLDSFF
ncbi:TPM domain-containing protein [Providencia manganoxydans]|uniref:TPM domain-containing protein n=1 Tax=Providencia manganoxydans TaxID=2923283 RepID=UPI003AF34F61